MTNEIEQGLHEKLCAFILGEASEEVRAEVEKALEASAELRAERERIEATIGLVQTAMASGEALPTDAASEILADARALRKRPWYALPSVRIAAGVAAAALIGVGYMMTFPGRPPADPIVAMGVPTHSERAAGKLELPAAKAAEEPQLLAFEKKENEAPPPANAPLVAGGEAGQRVVDSTTLDHLDRLQQLGYVREGEKDAGAVIEREATEVLPNVNEPTVSGSAIGVGSPPFAARHLGSGPRKGRAGPATGAPSSTPPQSLLNQLGPAPAQDGPADHSDDFFLGSRKALAGLGYAGDDRDELVGGDLSTLDKLRQLDPSDRDQWIDSECARILRGCQRRPSERPRDMFFRFYGDNAFEFAALDPLSTFSVDVDTASYALARRYLNEGRIPEKAQIRTEEFVNYFKADVPAPTQGTFAIHTDLAPSRFSSDKQRSMLRVVVRGREVAKQERQPLNLTFVLDVSGSMREQNRLEMVKHAVRLLVGELGSGDNLALVAFSTDARTVLPMTSVKNRSAIESALETLEPENSTNSEAGLKLGYSIALANINPEAQNRVVFLSDGVANVGETDPAKLSESVKPIREKGIYLNTIGVGMNNHNDVLLEQLADKGDGVCSYIDSPSEAKKVIVDGFTGAFETIARDVKVQVEFDPAQVERYRLLGYENRAIADKDFRNDKIDAGEVGAGHQVTALYEIERATGASEKPLATVRLRWKAPRRVHAPAADEEATEIAQPVLASQEKSFEGAGPGYRRAVIVAQFAEFLRRSVHARGDSLDDLIAETEKLERETHDPEIGELVVLLHKSKELIRRALPDCDDLCRTIEAVRRNALLRCEHEMLAKEVDAKLGIDLEKQNAEFEKQIKELLRRKLEERVK
jgi:Ca-activated chloride channel family protein